MPSFYYKARNRSGKIVEGRVDAVSAMKLADQLVASGIVPVSIREEKSKVTSPKRQDSAAATTLGGGVKAADVIFFSRQMHTMMRAGVPVFTALDGLAQTTANPAMKQIVNGLRDGLNAGRTFSTVLRAYPKVFSRLYANIVLMGETSGNLPESFRAMADFLQQDKDIRERVKGAMRYPIIVLIAITIAMVVVNVKVIPAFQGIFDRLGSDLPLMTQVLIATSKFFQDYWVAMFFGTLIGTAALVKYVHTPAGAYQWDTLKLRIPGTGPIVRQAALARFARALAMTSRAGVPVAQALPVVSQALGNLYIEGKLRVMQAKLEQGASLTRAAEATGLFPGMVLQMLHTGEETGAVEELVTQLAEYYEREVDYSVKGLSAVIEPLLLLVVGIMVLILALGVFMPMWNLMDAFKK